MSEHQRKFLINDEQMYAVRIHLWYMDISGNARTAMANTWWRAFAQRHSLLFGPVFVKCKCSFRSTNSKWIAFNCSSNVHRTNECCLLRLYYTSISTFLSFPCTSFSIRTQIWTRLNTLIIFIYLPPLLRKISFICTVRS